MEMDEGKLKMAREQLKRCGGPKLVFHGLDGPLLGVTGETKSQGRPKTKTNIILNTTVVTRMNLEIINNKEQEKMIKFYFLPSFDTLGLVRKLRFELFDKLLTK